MPNAKNDCKLRQRMYEPMNEQINGIVLAGGKSSRMGENKALLKFRNKQLIEYSIDALKPFCNEILISGNVAEYAQYGYKMVNDVVMGIGAMGGIYSALLASSTERNLIVSCDIPLIDTELIQLLLHNHQQAPARVVQQADGKIEPLVGIYSKQILPFLEQQIENKNYKMMHLLASINAEYQIIASTYKLQNINTKTDFDTLKINY